MNKKLHSFRLLVLVAAAPSLRAQTTTPAPAPASPAVPPAAATAPAAPTSPVSTPSVGGPLTINPTPAKFDLGKLGTWYIDGVVSGLAFAQDNVAPGDRTSIADVDNAMVFVNKVDGVLQFFAQAGAYSIPDLGAAYVRSDSMPNLLYGAFPQGFVKVAPNSTWSVEFGKLPTLVGEEYTWSFENMNIERGLLWNQEPAVSRGAQLNFTQGPVTLGLSWNDGLYSNHYSWCTFSAAYTINSSNSATLVLGGNTKKTTVNTFATPIFQNNEEIANLIYSHTSGPWTLAGYFQYTEVPKSATIGTGEEGDTSGFAGYADYAFDPKDKLGDLSLAGVNLAARVEYITSTGSLSKGAPNLLYGPGSDAWSFTITPTYQYKIFFARLEGSVVTASGVKPGYGFGPNARGTSQTRGLAEVGILF